MDYDKVTEYIFNLRKFGDIRLGLERVQYLLDRLGNPEKKLKYVHVGGTNGKGSTTAMVSSILSCAGYKVGTFTSPHLSDFTERIVIKGKKIPEGEVVRLFDKIMPFVEMMKKEKGDTPTFFEFITALTLQYFFENKVDIAVMEVGLGGRLDSTNVINPEVSVITNIALEHTDILGNTRTKIAIEKAGIIKHDSALITAVDPPIYKIFKNVCGEMNSDIYLVGSDIKVKGVESTEEHQVFDIEGFKKQYKGVYCRLVGDHQLCNAGCAFGAVEVLNRKGFKISEGAFKNGLKTVVWPGRLELMQKNPKVVLDGAKDPLAMKALKEALTKIFKYKKLITVIGVSSDKKAKLMLDQIAPISDLLITTKHEVMGRALDPKELAKMILGYNKSVIVTENVGDALDEAMKYADKDSLICITGSLFIVGEARERWHKEVVIWGRETNESRSEKYVAGGIK